MRGSVVGPLAMGGIWAVVGAGGALLAGAPLLAAVAAYSLCGAAGVLMGGLAAMRTDDGAPPPAPAMVGPEPPRRLADWAEAQGRFAGRATAIPLDRPG